MKENSVLKEEVERLKDIVQKQKKKIDKLEKALSQSHMEGPEINYHFPPIS